MESQSDPANFLDAVRRREPCRLLIPFCELPSIIEGLADLGIIGKQAPDGWSGLRSLCPECTAWVDGDTLGMIFAVQQMGRDGVSMSGYGDLSNLLNSHCTNPSCSSSDILLVWHGHPGIRSQLVRHLDRVRAHFSSAEFGEALDCINKLEDHKALTFAQDAIFGLERRVAQTHLIVGRRFPDMVIWVSALPSAPGAVPRAFPEGYKQYFSRLLTHSEYDQGQLSVAHWLSFVHQDERKLTLAAVSSKENAGTPREFGLLPTEIVEESGDA